jgi:hypothetical protein
MMKNGQVVQQLQLPTMALLSALFLAVTPAYTADREAFIGNSGALEEDSLIRIWKAASDPVAQERAALYDQIEGGLQFFTEAFGPDFIEKMRRAHREQAARELEDFVREICPIKQNAALVTKQDGTLHVVMPSESDQRVKNGLPFKDPLDLKQLDASDELRRLKIDYIAGVIADGVTLHLVSSGDRVRGAFGQCMIYSLNKNQPLFALGYARALGEDGDPLWAELAGFLYASGRLTYRDLSAAEKYLKLGMKKGRERNSLIRIRKTIQQIKRYQRAGGENLVIELK